MPHRVPPIARIRLARSLPRLLAWPVLVVGTGAMASASWLLGSFGSGLGGVVFAGLGAVLMLIGFVGALVLLSIRLAIEEEAVRLSWLGGERIYPLTQGPVTRVRLRGEDASRLRPRIGMFGWAIGPARLRDSEEVHVVRLARTRTAILVPTERGRLAIAAADEAQLLDALSRAARARRRLEELQEAAAEHPPIAADAPVEIEARVMTGIERALLEERLARERLEAEAALLAAARQLAEQRAAEVEDDRAPSVTVAETAADPAVPEAAGRPRTLRAPHPSAALVLLPLVGAGVAWGIGLLGDTYPDPASDLGRLTSLALVLAGPATSVGAIMARAWWPRLVGVVVTGGLGASVFIARALLG